MRHIKIQQSNLTELTNFKVIHKIYDIIVNSELDNNSLLQGILSSSYVYDDEYDYFLNLFNSFQINYTIDKIIKFADSKVEQKMIGLTNTIYPSANYEGVIKQLALTNTGYNTSMYGFRKIFQNDTEITSFNEMSRLINCKRLAIREFEACTNLVSVDLTNIEKLSERTFYGDGKLEYFNGHNSVSGDLRLPNLAADGLAYYATFYWSNGVGPKIKRILDLGNCTSIGYSGGGSTFQGNIILEYVDPIVLENITLLSNSFSGCTSLVIDDLKLPHIETIGNNSFYKTKVKKISELHECVIYESSFADCTSLTEISQDALNNITSLGRYAFSGCTSLVINDLKLPNLTNMNDNCFEKCNITSVSNLGTVTTVTGFTNCTSLTSITLPQTATAIGGNAFNGCTNLQSIDITNIAIFWDNCFNNTTCLSSVLYLPNVTTSISYTSFRNASNIRSMYLPHMHHTNGPNGTATPASVNNTHRGNKTFYCGSDMSIMYFKDLEKINGGTFGGRSWMGRYNLDIIYGWYTSNFPEDYEYVHIENGNIIREFRGNLQIPILFNSSDGGTTYHQWANIKYLVINNLTPPTYWMSYTQYGGVYGEFGLYGKDDRNNNESFHYLVVPRAAINDYLAWDAFHPDLSSPNLPEEERQKILNDITFNNDDPNNPRIIAIESMGHFATKADYDAAPDMPDGHHYKEEYLIEEYMDLTTPIQWDSTPTWSI